MNILLVEDDTALAALIKKSAAAKNLAVTHAALCDEAAALLAANRYDVLVLDRMLPDKDGLQFLRELRERGDNTPTLILSALGEIEDRVAGLGAGGDDYLIKPFAFAELEARLVALARRGESEAAGKESVQQIADLTLDKVARRVTRGDTQIDLSPREFDLLAYLIDNREQAVTRKMLLQNVWQHQFHTQTNVVDMHISKLRAKVDKDFAVALIQTERGVGFKISQHNGGAKDE